MKISKRTTFLLCALATMQLAAPVYAASATGGEARTSITVQGSVAQGMNTGAVEASRDEYGPLRLSGQRSQSTRSAAQQQSAGQQPAQQKSSRQLSAMSNPALPNTDFWFYTADVELFDDRDRDGFYTGISLLFDADTYYEFADVYAVIYLSYEYGEWNEYAETEVFTILGASAADEYTVETDLVAGYPSGSYDILIELYGAYDDAFVASLGPEDSSELAILPLEDAERDSLVAVSTTQVVVSSGGGGTTSWMFLLALAFAAVRFRKR